MPFVSAKCPNCGASIQMDNQQESGLCQYCGSKVQIKEAIAKVKIDKTMSLANYRELAMSAFRGNDGDNALKYAEMALEINSHDAEMWFLKGRVALLNSGKIVNDDLILECVRNAVKYAPNQQMRSDVNQFLYEAACEILSRMDDEDVTDPFWETIFPELEMAAVRLIKEVPEDFTNANGENVREKFAESYIEFLQLHISKDNAYQWAQARKDRYFDLALGSMSEKEAVWKKNIDGHVQELEIQAPKSDSLDKLNKRELVGCFIFLVILNIFLWSYIFSVWQRILN